MNDFRSFSDAMADANVPVKHIDQCANIITHLQQSTGTTAGAYITGNPLCGASKSHKPLQRRTRKRRAKQIRAELKPELQAVGLLPLGPIFWLLITSPSVWAFLWHWIMGVLAEAEESGE